MPPFRTGLTKRKLNRESEVKEYNEKTDKPDTYDDLFSGKVNLEEENESDSENEGEQVDSDGENDEVLFDDDDVDSTLGEEDLEGAESAEESSDLTDSEADNDSEDDDESEEDADSDVTSDDSGAATGNGLTQSDVSNDEATSDKSIIKIKKKVKTNNKKLSVVSKKVEELNNDKGKVKEADKSLVRLVEQIKETNIKPVEKKDEYSSGDSSDEEDRRTTIGEIPAHWYDEYDHVGYDLDGRRIIKPPKRDQIDEFLRKCEDPDFWRTVRDPTTGQDVVLSKEDLELIARIRGSKNPSATHDEYEPWVEWFTREVLATPIRAFPDHKRSFLPSKSEQRAISKIVHALKMGWAKTRKQLAEERRIRKEKKFYNLWASSDKDEELKLRGIHRHIPAPKRALPSHAESYNPPPEYLLDKQELKEWNKLEETPWKRKYTFLPTKHKSLREVGAYPRFTRERFLRCLDLYLAPRAIKMRLTITAEDLVPKLPSPRDLQPFPTQPVLRFKGHTDMVRSCDFDPTGQYVASGSEDGTVKVWEVSTGRCLRTVDLGEPVLQVAWCPAAALTLVACASGKRVAWLNPAAGVGAHKAALKTDELLEKTPPPQEKDADELTAKVVSWAEVTTDEWAKGIRLVVNHSAPVLHINWHARGDYLSTALGDRGAVVHQVSRRRSRMVAKRDTTATALHPTQPALYCLGRRTVRVLPLAGTAAPRTLRPGAQWLSNLALHPRGSHLLTSSYDRSLAWFDLELSARPYRTLRLHSQAVRSVAFHSAYPLFCSVGDDPYLQISHATVYNDLLQNPLLVPLKQLRPPWLSPNRQDNHREAEHKLNWLSVVFHPHQPWVLAAHADHTMTLFA